RNSGRDVDKAKETGLVPVFEQNLTYFEQATVVLKCRKLAKYDLSPEGFIDKSVQSNYTDGDYHKMFIAEIEEVLVRA
ncbi:MAG: flavin reductase family protein, partial [Acutalibacteraceae bacterium]